MYWVNGFFYFLWNLQTDCNLASVHCSIIKISYVCIVYRYMYGTIEEHAEQIDTQYDAVVASEVLEHVDATDLFINTCAETVRVSCLI